MKLVELQKVFHPMENVHVIYRDPLKSLQVVNIYDGSFKNLSEQRILCRKVVCVLTEEITKEIYIEIE